MKISRINIGEIIRQKVEEKKITNAKFAKDIRMQRQNVNKMVFEKNSIDTDLLITISEILSINFFEYYKSDEECNKKDYNLHEIKEVKAYITLEVGHEKKEQTFSFSFEKNNIEI